MNSSNDIGLALQAVDKRRRDAAKLTGAAYTAEIRAINSALSSIGNSLRASRAAERMPGDPPGCERRYRALADFELRSVANGLPTITGYAAVFNSPSHDMGGFREVVLPGAFKRSLDSGEDVAATIGHDNTRLLGRSESGTLLLAEDETGLRFSIRPPRTTYAEDLVASMRRGDIRGASFSFAFDGPNGQRWTYRNGGRIRQVVSVKLYEVSIVAAAAYPAASATIRALLRRHRFGLTT